MDYSCKNVERGHGIMSELSLLRKKHLQARSFSGERMEL